MKRLRSLQLVLLAAVCHPVPLPTAHAAIVISGDVDPADPASWSSSIHGYVGYTADGELEVNGGSDLVSRYGYIGCEDTVTGAVTVTGAGSTWTNSQDLNIGDSGSGMLNISSGGSVLASGRGYIGRNSGSTGQVMVDGVGSTWTGGHLNVGYRGSGTLNITSGAAAGSTRGYIGRYSGSTGVVMVDGTGSTWANSGDLDVGRSGNGTLHITGGGNVSAADVSINSESLLAIDVGNGSLLQIVRGIGTIDNDGEVRILAGAGAMAGSVHQPITAGYFSGSGTYQAVGGTWDETSHQFTVSDVASGTSGSMVTIDRSLTQRLLADDAQTGWSVGASFLAADVASELNLTATAVSGPALAELLSLLDAGDSVLGAWTFDVTGGYAEGDPAYLSFDLGPGFDQSEVNLWHHDGSQWTEYAAADLTCNGNYASFTVTGFSGYAVSVVPEPGSLAMLLGGVAGLIVLCWRRRNG